MTVHLPVKLRKEIIELVSSYTGVEKVILFGSRARGDHDERSNVDLAVEGSCLSHKEWVQLSLTLEEDLDSLLFVDVIRLERAPEKLLGSIKKEGRVLYERGKGQEQSG
ncbi:MAG TPA: nucleotidyltransferase domain-containing protein [Bacillales bacterium]|nr:nucleotidyltransferase domain-containing protein [Bacillales bacterium]